MAERVYTTEPSPLASLASLLKPRPAPKGAPRFPDEVAVVPRARVAVRRLGRYRDLLGLPDTGGLPPLYPHVELGRLHLAMLAAPSFPLSMLGAVHVGTAVRQHDVLPVDAVYGLRAWFEGVTVLPKGVAFGLVSEVLRGDEVVWTSLNTYQVKGRFGEPGGDLPEITVPKPEEGELTPAWSLPSSLGRRYAGVCGDYNPIHLTSVTARLFGFPRHIVHGYANLAIALDRVGVRQGPGALDALFKGPVPLGSEAWALRDDQARFEVYSAADPRPSIAAAWREGAGAPLPR